MSAPIGWLKLHRKMMNSELFNDPDLLRLWMLCLMKASHSYRVVDWQGERIELKPGQFLTGRQALHNDYNEGLATKHKVKDTTLWNRLKKIEKMGSLKIENIASRKCSIVTLLNWDEHQMEKEEHPEEERKPEVNQKEEAERLEKEREFLEATEQVGKETGGELAPAPKKQRGVKREYTKDDTEYYLANYLFYWMLQNNEKAKKPNPQKWSDVMRLMIERDNRDPNEIKQVIYWCQNNDFWYKNILSPEKLRKQYDTLYIQMMDELKKKNKNTSSSRGAKKNDLLKDLMHKETNKEGYVYGTSRNDQALLPYK